MQRKKYIKRKCKVLFNQQMKESTYKVIVIGTSAGGLKALKKINRTYTGPTYLGGVSDHLPVYLDLEWIVQP